MIRALIALCGIALLGGCGALVERGDPGPVNPSFPVNYARGRAVLDEAAAHPRGLERPLVVVGGDRKSVV